MKKKLLIASISVAFCSLLAVSAILPKAASANEAPSQRAIELAACIDDIVIDSLTADDYEAIASYVELAGTMSDAELNEVGADRLAKLEQSKERIADLRSAELFNDDLAYALNRRTQKYAFDIADLDSRYNGLSAYAKGLVNYDENVKGAIAAIGKTAVPDIYYDFSKVELDESGDYARVINQGKEEGNNAIVFGELEEEVSFSKGYLQLSGGYLKFKSNTFSSQTDFTMSIVYEPTAHYMDVGNQSIMSLSTVGFNDNKGASDCGFRVYYGTFFERGPFYNVRALGQTADFGYGPILHAQKDDIGHVVRTTVRYYSAYGVIQFNTIDLNTGHEYYFNSAEDYNKTCANDYFKYTSEFFDASKLKDIIIGGKSGCGMNSFGGKIHSFSLSRELLSNRELYGDDERKIVAGHQDVIEYINSFEKVGAKFDTYKEAMAPTIRAMYHEAVSLPYDYYYLVDQSKLANLIEAYNLLGE